MSVKAKISKAKRNNQKKNKLIKQGVIKKGSKKVRKQPKDLPNKVVKHAAQTIPSDEESDHGEDMLQMVEEDDLNFLKKAITNRSYSILNKVKYFGSNKAKKRKLVENDDTLENAYEDQIEDTSGKRVKVLLPIKTQKGLVHKEIVEDISEDEPEDEKPEQNNEADDGSDIEEEDEFILQDADIDLSKPISAAQLLAARNEVLRQKKIHIGTLSSGLLENPEEKITNLRTLLNLMDDETPEVYFTVRKLVIVSLVEVFKDILPDYEIKNVNPEGVKLKKDTLKLQKYEENLLLYYKKFLQKVEKYCFMLVKKKGNSRRLLEEEVKVSELSIQALCDLLVAHPYFNYSQNIAQVLVPFLNSPRKNVRDVVKKSITTVFKEDKKEEVTLKILRLVNNYLKTHAQNVNVEMLEILLVLNLRDVNLDLEKEQEIKNKKLQAKKAKLLQMSKKERKRKKKLQELEKEMLETKAEENKQVKQQNLTEITKIIFNIYFRILKNSENTKMLSACLEGLAKFANCINLEYYVDIVNVLNHLLNEEWLGYKEQLHCIQTIFIMLSGQGEAINIDPTRFYVNLYKDLLTTNAGRNHANSLVVLKTLVDALIKRRKKITNKRIINFVKRLATLSLQLLHNGSLGCLGLVKTLMQLNRSVDILLDLDSSGGEGRFQPEIEDPEYANASNTALFETVLLSKHYHPAVRKFSRYISGGVPATGDGSLPLEYGKLTIEQLYEDFDMSQMAFNPPVPVMKNASPKTRPNRKDFVDPSFHEECQTLLKTKRLLGPLWEPYVVTEDSDFAEGSEDETKSTEWYTKDNEFESESQESGSIHRSGKQSGCNEDDEDSDRLVIDEPEDDSESEIVDVEEYYSQEECPESVSFYGALLKIDPKEPECPLCAKIFQSAGTLKQHFKLCRAKSVDLCENGGSQEIVPESKDGLKNLKIDQIFSVGDKSGLPENEDGLSNLKIGQIFSVQDKFTNLGNGDSLRDSIEFKSENRDGLSNVKIKQVFSVENDMVQCFAKDCKFTGTTAGVTRHYRKIHIANRRHRNTCTNCDMTFDSIVSREAHHKFCKACIKKPKIQDEASTEIIEIDDD